MRAVPRLDEDQARVGRGDGGHFLQAHVGAVGLDHEVGDEIGRGLAGADAGELGLDHLRAFDHFFFRFEENIIKGHS